MDFLRDRPDRWESGFSFAKFIAAGQKRWIEGLRTKAEHKELPEFLTLREIGVLSGKAPDVFEEFIVKTNLEITERAETDQNTHKVYSVKGATRSAYKAYLISKGLWPADGLLANWWSSDETKQPTENDNKIEPTKRVKELDLWWKHRDGDPDPRRPWYTPARYFARELVAEDESLLDKSKTSLLAGKVAAKLFDEGIKPSRKRNGSDRFDTNTVKKAFSRVDLSKKNPT